MCRKKTPIQDMTFDQGKHKGHYLKNILGLCSIWQPVEEQKENKEEKEEKMNFDCLNSLK